MRIPQNLRTSVLCTAILAGSSLAVAVDGEAKSPSETGKLEPAAPAKELREVPAKGFGAAIQGMFKGSNRQTTSSRPQQTSTVDAELQKLYSQNGRPVPEQLRTSSPSRTKAAPRVPRHAQKGRRPQQVRTVAAGPSDNKKPNLFQRFIGSFAPKKRQVPTGRAANVPVPPPIDFTMEDGVPAQTVGLENELPGDAQRTAERFLQDTASPLLKHTPAVEQEIADDGFIDPFGGQEPVEDDDVFLDLDALAEPQPVQTVGVPPADDNIVVETVIPEAEDVAEEPADELVAQEPAVEEEAGVVSVTDAEPADAEEAGVATVAEQPPVEAQEMTPESTEAEEAPAVVTTEKEEGTLLPPVDEDWKTTPQKNAPKISRSPALDSRARQEQQRYLIMSRAGRSGFKGFCPVQLRDERALIDSRDEFSVEFGQSTYKFSSPEAKAAFEANPARYAPAAGGNDVVLLINTAEDVKGSLDFCLWYRDRLYMFRSRESQHIFAQDPARYAKAH